MFPGPFTLAAAEAIAGDGAGLAVLRLVDCSLLVPPRAGPDGRFRYSMLETLRAYGARLLAAAGEQEQAAAALAGWAVEMAEQAAPGLQTRTGEAAAARWLDAEDATMRQVLAWGMGRDRETALRLAAALDSWWYLLGRLPGLYPLLAELAGYAEPRSDRWCSVQQAVGWAAHLSNDMAGALDVFTVLRDAVADRPPSRVLADALAGRSLALMARRYLAGHAPAADRDLARWAGIGLRDARLGLARLARCGAVQRTDGPGRADRGARLPDCRRHGCVRSTRCCSAGPAGIPSPARTSGSSQSTDCSARSR